MLNTEMNDTKELILAFQKNRDYDFFAKQAISKPGCIEELIELCYSNKFPYPNYSSWLLAQITDRHTEIIAPYQIKLIDCLLSSTNETVQRNLLHSLLVFPLMSYVYPITTFSKRNQTRTSCYKENLCSISDRYRYFR